MGPVLLTGATGFVGREILNRFLERDGERVYALVRADDDSAAAERLPTHPRLSAVAGDIERTGLGLGRATRDRLAAEVTTVVHCAASVSFELGLAESRRVNVDGTRHLVELAERFPRLERFSYVSTAYVAGEPRGLFREDQLEVGQRFRNPYEQSKFEAELALRDRGAGLPLQILRPSIVVGDSRTGRTSSFNVLYGPLKAFARGAIPAIPARRSAPVDIVPVDYVADRTVELASGGPDGTFHLVAGRNATTVGRLLELASQHLGRRAPAVLPPPLYRRVLHPMLRRKYGGLRRMEVYFPYFSMRVRFDDRRLGPAPSVEGYFGRLMSFAQAARWGRRQPPRAGVPA
jgi:thioester reductase-like protein